MKLKILWETLLLAIFLHEKARNNQKMTKVHSSRIDLGFLTSLLTFRLQMLNIYGFLHCFTFRNYWATSCCVLRLRLSSSNYELKFGSNKRNFCCVDELVCYCRSNQYSEVGCFLLKIVYECARSKG